MSFAPNAVKVYLLPTIVFLTHLTSLPINKKDSACTSSAVESCVLFCVFWYLYAYIFYYIADGAFS